MSLNSRWYLYLLECEDGSLYTGITTDFDRRFAEHLSDKGARYTRSHPPQRLLAAVPGGSRSEDWMARSSDCAFMVDTRGENR